MTRMIKDYVEVGEFTTLDEMIARLSEIRDSLHHDAETEMRIRGDAVFGRHLCVGFKRPLTAEEAACEGRYQDEERRLRSVA